MESWAGRRAAAAITVGGKRDPIGFISTVLCVYRGRGVRVKGYESLGKVWGVSSWIFGGCRWVMRKGSELLASVGVC